jgi:predicted phage-related endonuclease
MKIINLVQGTPEWHAWRAGLNLHGRRRRPASIVPVMMGASPHMTRSELVRIWATGDEREFTEWERKFLLEKGHEVEALARPLLEEDLGTDFYPVTIADDMDLNTASMDGLTMDNEEGLEHKLWNAELAAAIRRGDPPAYIYWQLEGQLLAGSGALKRIHLVCSDGTRENRVSMVYERVPGRYKQIIDAWAQFEEDVANYQHVEVHEKPAAAPQTLLPAPVVDVEGAVTLKSDLEPWGHRLRAYIATIPVTPSTDQEFADAEAACKNLKVIEDRLELVESTTLSRFTAIETFRTTIAELRELARVTRLEREKLVESRKKAIRSEILEEGVRAFNNHVYKQNERLGRPLLTVATVPMPKFGDAMKGKKTIASLRDAVATTLAHAKIAVNEIADRVDVNLKYLKVACVGQEALFRDLNTIAFKAPEDFAMLVKVRLDEEAVRLEKIREEAKAAAVTLGTAFPPASLAPTPAPALRVVSGATPRADTTPVRLRPTDHELVAVLAHHYAADTETVLDWLLEFDVAAVRRHLAQA